MTKRYSVLLAGSAFAALVFAAGCRTTHLGQDTAGYTYKAAMRAQAEGDDTVEPPEFSAEDAKTALQVHRTGKAETSATTTTTTPLFAPMTMTSSSGDSGSAGGGTGMWPGSTGNITLEAK